ncbi:hypothetical protein HDU85_004871 [Gaertneriomyces sp. JEL0708]|nr:hypothetical protein HDU85_004871 [Gaertneriomyces sp. JEL0708]
MDIDLHWARSSVCQDSRRLSHPPAEMLRFRKLCSQRHNNERGSTPSPKGLAYLAHADFRSSNSFMKEQGAGLVGGVDHPHYMPAPPYITPDRHSAASNPPVSIIARTFLQGFNLSRGTLSQRASDVFYAYPLTTLHAACGASLHICQLVGLISYRAILFHPRLVTGSQWQLHRVVTSFMVLGGSVVDVVQRAVSMFFWQAPLEKWFDGDGDLIRNGAIVRAGTNRRKPSGARKSIVEWLVTDNQFLRAQVLACAVLVGLELALFRRDSHMLKNTAPGFASLAAITGTEVPLALGEILLFPYSMFPNLEYAFRWLWAITDNEEEHRLFGIIAIRPVYLPIALCALGGLSAWKPMMKGLVAALIVSKVMDLRRADQQKAVDWAFKVIADWFHWGTRLTSSQPRPSPPDTASPWRQTQL